MSQLSAVVPVILGSNGASLLISAAAFFVQPTISKQHGASCLCCFVNRWRHKSSGFEWTFSSDSRLQPVSVFFPSLLHYSIAVLCLF